MDLQQRQRDVLARMFTDIPGGASAASASPEMDVLTTPGVSSAAAAAAVSWKVLIYDSFGQSVLASLFSVGELKRLGVTLHLMLHSARDPIHDVPAVYFCRPTAENIARIEKDMSQGVYDSVHLNFTSLPDPAFHSLATRLGRAGVAGSVLTVSDQWSECVSLDPNLFTFSHPHSFASLHAPSLPDATREYWLRRTALGAAGLIAAAGAMPVIRAPPEEGPARAVASLLSQMLRAHPDAVTGSAASSASAGTAAAAASVSTQRPLVVVLDRSSDLASPLHHAWTYLPLIADLLGLKGMRVPVPDGVTSAAAQGGMWDLDPRDPFYAANACAQVSAAAERLTGAVAEYWADAEALKQRTQSSAGADGLATASTELAGAIASLPALTRRKKQLDIHTSMGPPLLKTIKTRKLDEYHAFEESVLSAAATGGTAGTGAGVDRAALRELVKMKEGTVLDKLRAVLIAYVATESPEMGFYKHIFAELEQLADREGSLITSAKGSSSTASGSPSPAAATPAAAPGSTKSADDDFAAALMSDGPSSSSSSSAGTQSSASAAEDDIELGLSGAAAPGQRVRRLRPLVSAAIKHAQSAKLAQATMQAIRARASASPSNAGGAAGGAFGGAAGGLFAFARSVIDRSAQALSNFSDKSVMLPVSLTVKALLAADQQQQQMPHHARAAGGAGGAGGVGSSAAAAAAAVSAQFLHFDPLSTRTLPDGQTPPQARVPLGSGIGGRRVIVVMVGGGSYAEYANLQELAAELTEADAAALGGYASSVGGVRPEVSIVYAATELMTPTEFVEAMSELGGPGEARAAVGELIREHGTESFPA